MDLCGVNISCHHHDDLLSLANSPNIIVTVNAEAIVRSQRDKRLRSIINNNISTIDGQIPLWLYRHKYKDHKIEKISGSELIYTLPEYAAKENLKVFLLGGKEDSNHGAIEKLRQKYPTLEIDGYSPPFSPYPFSSDLNNTILTKIRNFKPDILFVGFGMGKQEYWEEDNYEILKEVDVKLIIGCGGSFEFASGKIKRAPKIVQQCGLEGAWRLLKEFKWFRLKRILLSSYIFYYYLITK